MGLARDRISEWLLLDRAAIIFPIVKVSDVKPLLLNYVFCSLIMYRDSPIPGTP